MRTAEVLFPTCGPEPRMNRVRVIAYPDRHNGMRSCASDRKVAQVKRLLSYCRDGEGIETLDTDVVVGFDDDDFDGQSFGLPLALADKLARFPGENDRAIVICATGVLKSRGAVGGVDAFTDKLILAHKILAPGSVFIYPEANRSVDPASLERLSAAGIEPRYVKNLSELSDFWNSASHGDVAVPKGHRFSPWRRWVHLAAGISVGLMLPTMFVLAYLLFTEAVR